MDEQTRQILEAMRRTWITVDDFLILQALESLAEEGKIRLAPNGEDPWQASVEPTRRRKGNGNVRRVDG
jgi:hypothetical protein